MTLRLCSAAVLVMTTLAALLAVPDPASANASDLKVAAATNMPSTTTSVSCAAGGLTGEARLTLSSDGTKWRTTVDSYRITANGRSKANINPYVSGRNFVGQLTLDHKVYSRDAMVQDGRWHDLGLSLDRASLPWTAMSQNSSTGVEFVFDKSGSDPRCTAGRSSSNPSRSVQHVATSPGVIDRMRPLTSCHVLSDAISCSIAESKSVSSTLTLSGSANPTGDSLKWLTAGISKSWTSTRTVDVRCTSAPMNRGQLFVAYPMGTTTDFRVRANVFGVQIDGPGKAFEVASGIACEVV